MNKNKWFLNGGRGSGKTFRLLCEAYENKIAELERKLEQTEKDLADYQFNYPTIKELQKENTELKKKLNVFSNESANACFAHNEKSKQLTKAKELLKEFVHHYKDKTIYIENMQDLLEQAEQFLKESG